MREYLHTLYQFTDRWVVDDTKFRDCVRRPQPPPSTTPSPTTLQWYRDSAQRAAANAAH